MKKKVREREKAVDKIENETVEDRLLKERKTEERAGESEQAKEGRRRNDCKDEGREKRLDTGDSLFGTKVDALCSFRFWPGRADGEENEDNSGQKVPKHVPKHTHTQSIEWWTQRMNELLHTHTHSLIHTQT